MSDTKKFFEILRRAVNLSVGEADEVYTLLDVVENLINPEYEGSADEVRTALSIYSAAVTDREAKEAADAIRATAQEAGEDTSDPPFAPEPTITLNGSVYVLQSARA